MLGLEKLNEIVANRESFQIEKKDSEGQIISVTFRMNPAASFDQVDYLEQLIKKSLPVEYKEFLTTFNGARLYDYEGIDGFQFLSCEEIIKANNFAIATFEEDWCDDLLIFAKYIGESNYLACDTSSNDQAVIDCYFEEMPNDWSIIAKNFNEFLQLLIESEGSKYWLK